jgi:hypothetical protein
MKHLILINIILVLLLAKAQAAPISVGNIDNIYVANQLLAASGPDECTSQTTNDCHFIKAGPLNPDGSGNPIFQSMTDLEAFAANENPADYVLSPYQNHTYLELGFGNDINIYNGEGNDLVVFIVGNTTSFGLQIYDQTNTLINLNTDTFLVATPEYHMVGDTIVYDDPGDTVFDSDGNWLGVDCGTDPNCTDGAALSAIFFDLDDFGDDIAGIGKIRIELGESYNVDGNRPFFSLAGGFHTEASITAVPLPLPIILFSSGLALLGWVGRRKSS